MGPIDGIGLQSHFTGYKLDPYQIKDNVDKLWNEFGIPMWVTEFTWSRGDIDDPNHEIHAKQLENYYRLMFSLESIDGFLMWHFSNDKKSNISRSRNCERKRDCNIFIQRLQRRL